MAAGKSVKSHKLGYSIPKVATNTPATPHTAELVDPVSYIKFWDKYNHYAPVDISKAKKMTRADLMEADPRGIELMLSYGVTQKQIAMQYNVPYGSLTAIFKRLSVNTKVDSVVERLEIMDPPEHEETSPTLTPDVPEQELAIVSTEMEESPTEESAEDAGEYSSSEGPELSDQLKDAIDELLSEDTAVENDRPDYEALYPNYTWYDGSLKQTEQFLTVSGDGRFSLSSGIRRIFQGYLVAIGLSPDRNHIAIVPNEDSAYLIKQEKSRYRNPYLSEELSRFGIPLPAKYQMSWNESGATWEGTLVAYNPEEQFSLRQYG
ncbi:hypothetical protein [Sporomusa aerivorans]|uniref:hypothetical protein n=1 Tax=Sporomusa aerivorans TaxID=204936 RepID=UPI003529F852